MLRKIEVGDLVYKLGEIPAIDSDYGLVSDVISDKYTGARYITVYWLYNDLSETILEQEVILYKKSVKAYGKFHKEGQMGVEEWFQRITKIAQKSTKN
jgi:hypothetical protein